jgi:AraC-like DNA-binding protein
MQALCKYLHFLRMSAGYYDDLRFIGADDLPHCTFRIDQAFPTSLAVNYMPRGKITFQVADGPVHTVRGPCCLWIHGGMHLRYGAAAGECDWHIQWVMADGPRIRRLVRGGIAPKTDAPFNPVREPAAFEAKMRQLVALVQRGRAEDQPSRVLLYEELLAEGTRGFSPVDAALPRQIERLADDVAAAPCREWDFHQWAKLHGTSHAHFRRLFTERVGQAPHRYLLDCRLRWAAAQLAQGGRQVKEVAEAAGFSNAFYFSRIFRSRMGFPPGRMKG